MNYELSYERLQRNYPALVDNYEPVLRRYKKRLETYHRISLPSVEKLREKAMRVGHAPRRTVNGAHPYIKRVLQNLIAQIFC